MESVDPHVVEGGIEDVEVLVSHRLMMWEAIHPEMREQIEASSELTRQWLEEKLQGGKLVALLVKTSGGKVAGSGCIWLREEQPRPGWSRLEVPYLMSMYTGKEFRRQGVASIIVREAIEWCKRHGYQRIVLHASKEGRAIYEKIGFTVTDEMRLKLT